MKTLQELAQEVRVAIEQTTKYPDIAQTMADYTYNNEKLQEGSNLLAQTLLMQDAQHKEYGEQYEATDGLEKSKEEARSLYIEHVGIARIALKGNRGAFKLLSLSGERKRKTLGWLSQARIFYANAPQVAATLKRFGITAADIERGRQMIEAVQEASSQQKKERDEACQSTLDKNGVQAQLQDWMSRFKGVARVAFKDQPEKLRILGIRPVVRKRVKSV